jgi:hypothetical protein
MPDETAAETASSDLLDDLGITDLLGGADAVDSDDSDDSDDDDASGTVYDDVGDAELLTIDPETGAQVDVDPSQVSDSSDIQIVDDSEDGSVDDDLSVDVGLGLDDSAISISSDDLSSDGDFDDMDDV